MLNSIKFAAKWAAIAVWFDVTGRLIGAPLDILFSLSHYTAWLDGFSNVICH